MPDLAPTVDGTLARFNQSSWANAREGTSATNTFVTSTRISTAIQATKQAARGGGTSYHVYRAFFEFDTSGYLLSNFRFHQDDKNRLFGALFFPGKGQKTSAFFCLFFFFFEPSPP